eukprot:gene31343-6496_t
MHGHLLFLGYQDNAPSFKDGTGSIHTSYMAIKRRKCHKCKKVYQDTCEDLVSKLPDSIRKLLPMYRARERAAAPLQRST